MSKVQKFAMIPYDKYLMFQNQKPSDKILNVDEKENPTEAANLKTVSSTLSDKADEVNDLKTKLPPPGLPVDSKAKRSLNWLTL